MLKQSASKALVCAAIAAASIIPATSHAWLVGSAIGMALGARSDYVSGPSQSEFAAGFVICVLLAPLCLLEENAPRPSLGVSEAHLAQNGVAPADIALIRSSQEELGRRLAARNLRLFRGGPGGDTPASLRASILSVYPEAPPVYLAFLAEQAGYAPNAR